MGYPNPAESDYDLLMTGHAGASVSTDCWDYRSGDELMRPASRIGTPWPSSATGRFPQRVVVYEALNNAWRQK